MKSVMLYNEECLVVMQSVMLYWKRCVGYPKAWGDIFGCMEVGELDGVAGPADNQIWRTEIDTQLSSYIMG